MLKYSAVSQTYLEQRPQAKRRNQRENLFDSTVQIDVIQFFPKGRHITHVELVPLSLVINPMPKVKMANDAQISVLYAPVRETKMPAPADATAEEREYGSILFKVNTVVRFYALESLTQSLHQWQMHRGPDSIKAGSMHLTEFKISQRNLPQISSPPEKNAMAWRKVVIKRTAVVRVCSSE